MQEIALRQRESLPSVCIACGGASDRTTKRVGKVGRTIVTLNVPICEPCNKTLATRVGRQGARIAFILLGLAGMAVGSVLGPSRSGVPTGLRVVGAIAAIAVLVAIVGVVMMTVKLSQGIDVAKVVNVNQHQVTLANVSEDFVSALRNIRGNDAAEWERGVRGG